MRRLGAWACVAVLAMGFSACGDDSGGGGGGGGGKKLTSSEIAAGACEKMSGGATCEGQEDYAACAETMCSTQYQQCLGAGYKTGDFSGGTCETYMKCVSAAADSCNSGCTIDSACQNCFVNTVSPCVQSSGCASKLDCSTGGGAAGLGGGGGSGKTCGDLKKCCPTVDASQTSNCNTLADAKYDAVCATVYTQLGCK